MPSGHDWKGTPSKTIRGMMSWKYGTRYIELIDVDTSDFSYSYRNDAIGIRGKSADDGNKSQINIGIDIIEALLPRLNEYVAERRVEQQRIASLPECDYCGMHKVDGKRHEYKSLKICDNCFTWRSPAQLEHRISDIAALKQEVEGEGVEINGETVKDSEKSD